MSINKLDDIGEKISKEIKTNEKIAIKEAIKNLLQEAEQIAYGEKASASFDDIFSSNK